MAVIMVDMVAGHYKWPHGPATATQWANRSDFRTSHILELEVPMAC